VDLAVGLVALIAVVGAVTAIARRWDVPAPLLLVVVGVIASLLPFVPEFELEPELVLIGMLPPLLYAAAIRTSLIDFRSNRRPIALLSVGLVLVTMVAVAIVAFALLPISWAAAFALGAVVAPPDAVAATAIARKIGLPRRIVTILEGESLVNDATAVVALRTSVAALAGGFSLLRASGDFLIAALGGFAVGLVVAFVIGKIRKWVSDPVLDTTVSFITPFISYLAAEQIHASGVLAVVVTGILLGHKSHVIQNAASRISERTNWRTIQYVLENSVFLLIGLQVRGILADVADSELGIGRIATACLAVLVTVMLVRPLWVFPATYVPRWIPAIGRADPPPPWIYPAVVSWAGMRGVVTLATVFVLPADLVHREVLVLTALVVVAGTLLIQGFTLPGLVRVLGVRGPDPREDLLTESGVVQAAIDAGLAELNQLITPDDPETVVEQIRMRSRLRSFATWERLGNPDLETPTAAYARLRTPMLAAERAKVLELRDTGRIPDEVVRSVLESLDIEESMIEASVDELPEAREEDLLLVMPPQGGCEHLRNAPAMVTPLNPGGCDDCLAEGLRWVHLRLCLTCARVACCDSSPGNHMTKHQMTQSHPVMRSFEPGEAWRWCAVDSILG
jgi:CPA1 family monovalent cation:H+ antiporter